MVQRMVAPDGAIRQTEVRDPSGIRRRYESGSGFVTVSDHDARLLKQNGFTPASLTGVARGGRRCTDCGFGSWFTTCSRCGGECVREG